MGEIVVLLARVVGAGEAVVCHSLERQECFAIANFGELRGDAFAHEDVPLMLVLTDEAWVAAGVSIPGGRGSVAVAPSLGGTVAAVGGGEAVTSSATVMGCDPPASTRVGEAR